MHGLINRAIQCFIEDTYGSSAWIEIAARSSLPDGEFEALRLYDPALTDTLIATATKHLDKDRASLLEDLGTYLVSHPNRASLRRLLRFGGQNFDDFLHSIDDLPDWARLAVPDLTLPGLELHSLGQGEYRIEIEENFRGAIHVALGLLRGMADDYGVLAVLSLSSDHPGVAVQVHEHQFSAGRDFHLAASL
ncbi:heme NO-binding domain-containing protein [Aestuariibius insulae]|uniref:heme NO-binding domain-containing protein n=1 Tax=Aestuariibius insulae TaxID=2058287 RepID=UPI00345ECCA1